MHFFNPAPIMKLVEVVTTVETADDVTATVVDLTRKVGKHPVLCGDRAGFIVNALLFPYLNDAVKMLSAHYATADDIDTAMTKGCGLPMGPFALLDVVGNDVSLAIQEVLYKEFRGPAMPRRRCSATWSRQDSWVARPVVASAPTLADARRVPRKNNRRRDDSAPVRLGPTTWTESTGRGDWTVQSVRGNEGLRLPRLQPAGAAVLGALRRLAGGHAAGGRGSTALAPPVLGARAHRR